MSYTDLTTAFTYKSLLTYQKGLQLLANDNYVKDYFLRYKRPRLLWVDGLTLDVENNVTDDANATRIIFPDGDVRTVSEDVSITDQYRRLKLFSAHSLVAAHDSGGNSRSTSWSAIYAVKTSDDPSKFVLAENGTTPIPTNVATLNTAFGTNAWVYLGTVRAWNNLILGLGYDYNYLDFEMVGNLTMIKNVVDLVAGIGSTVPNLPGIFLGGNNFQTTVTYTFSEGMGDTKIPGHLGLVYFGWSTESLGSTVHDSTGTRLYYNGGGNGTGPEGGMHLAAASEGIRMTRSDAVLQKCIFLCGYFDSCLGVGSNPLAG